MNRYVWAAATLVAVSAGAFVLYDPAPEQDLPTLITSEVRSTLEQADPGQHNHAGHDPQPSASAAAAPEVICGVRVYGYEPPGAAELAEVKTVYGFHLCGVAEQKRPWDIAVKLAGPVIVDMSRQPRGIQVVEATEDVIYADRLKQMFPPKYADLASREALSEPEMAALRSRYEDAAGI